MFLANSFVLTVIAIVWQHSFPIVLCARQPTLKPLSLPQQPLRFQILSHYRGNYLQPRMLQINKDRIVPGLQPITTTTTTIAPIAQTTRQHNDKMYGTSSRNRNTKHRLRRLKTDRVDSYGTGKSKSRTGNNDADVNDNDLRFRFRSRARDMAGRAKDAKGYHNLYHKDETYKVEKFYDDDYSDHDYSKRLRDDYENDDLANN